MSEAYAYHNMTESLDLDLSRIETEIDTIINAMKATAKRLVDANIRDAYLNAHSPVIDVSKSGNWTVEWKPYDFKDKEEQAAHDKPYLDIIDSDNELNVLRGEMQHHNELLALAFHTKKLIHEKIKQRDA